MFTYTDRTADVHTTTDALESSFYLAGDTLYRVETFSDSDACSPRESTDANLCSLVTSNRSFHSPDKDESVTDFLPGEFVSDYGYGIDARRAALYLNLCAPDILAWGFLSQDNRDGSLSLYPGTGDHNSWSGESYEGLAVITRDRWVELMGADYAGDITPMSAIRQEVETYNGWCAGEYAGFVVSEYRVIRSNRNRVLSADWEEVDSCWSFESDSYAMSEGAECLPGNASEVTEVEELIESLTE